MNFFEIWQNGLWELCFGAILGLVQGTTEFLPISSTAHLRLISGLLTGRDIGLTTSNVIQFGTLLAILQYFRADLQVFWQRLIQILTHSDQMQIFIQTFQNWTREKSEKPNSTKLTSKRAFDETEKSLVASENKHLETDITLSQLLVGTLPIIILGFLLKSFAESNRNIPEIGLFMIIGAILLALGEHFHLQTKKLQHSTTLNFGETLLIGIFQSLAIFPGMSRSGSTLAGSLFLGRERQQSVRFAFLLSIPALFLSGLVDLVKLIQDILKNGVSFWPSSGFTSGSKIQLSVLTLLISFALSYLVGLICLKWLLKFLSVNTNFGFIIYRVVLGLFLILVGFISYSTGYFRF